jgi:hypothetical protein
VAGLGLPPLDAYEEVGPPLLAALGAADYPAREAALVEAVQRAAARHNALGLTEPVEETVGLFYTRPFRVLGSGRFVEACLERVSDPWLRSLPLVGAIDQLVDSTDVLSYPAIARRARTFYDG